MRIAFITHQWPCVRLGGIGAYTHHCARALAEAGHEPHVFTLILPQDSREAIPPRVVVHEVDSVAELARQPGAGVHAAGESVYRLAIGALLCEKVRAVHAVTPFDLVEGPEYEGMMLPLTLRPLSERVPAVVHIHSGSAIAHEASRKEGTAPADGIRAEALEFASLLAADAVCAPSQQVLEDTRRHCPSVIATVLPLPFLANPEVLAGTHSRTTVRALFVGRLEMVKGAHLLPEAANLFLRNHPAAVLRLAGPDTAGSPDAAIPSMAQWIRSKLDPAVAERVQFLGEQNAAQLNEEYRAATFAVVPSLFDSYSYVCCEALAAGLPVVVSDGIGATEVVGDAGVTFRRGDATSLAAAMGRLAGDGTVHRQLAANARRRSSTTLSIGETIERRIAFYQSLAAGKRGSLSRGERLALLPARYTGSLVAGLLQLTEAAAGFANEEVTPGARLLRILDRNSQKTGRPTRAMLYGAGRHTARLLAEALLWQAKGHQITALIDDHPRYQMEGARAHGLPVVSRRRVENWPTSAEPTVVVLSTDTFQEQFWEQTEALRARGASVYKLYE